MVYLLNLNFHKPRGSVNSTNQLLEKILSTRQISNQISACFPSVFLPLLLWVRGDWHLFISLYSYMYVPDKKRVKGREQRLSVHWMLTKE